MNIEYEIKYLNGDDILKLEKYLQDVAKHQSGTEYFFKFSPDRSQVSIKDKNGMINVVFTLSAFVEKLQPNLRMFLKFKHLEIEPK
jgi:hypothetical protein